MKMRKAHFYRRGARGTPTTHVFARLCAIGICASIILLFAQAGPSDAGAGSFGAKSVEPLVVTANKPTGGLPPLDKVLHVASQPVAAEHPTLGSDSDLTSAQIDSRGQARVWDHETGSTEAAVSTGFAGGAGSSWMRQLGIVAERNRQLQSEVAALKVALEQLSNETLSRRQAIADTEKEAAEARRRAAEADVAKAAAATAAAAEAARAAEAERLASAQASEAVQRALEEKRQSLAAELEAARQRQGAAEAELAAAQAEVAHVDSRTRQLALEVRLCTNVCHTPFLSHITGRLSSSIAFPIRSLHIVIVVPAASVNVSCAAASGPRADAGGHSVAPRSRVGSRRQARRTRDAEGGACSSTSGRYGGSSRNAATRCRRGCPQR